MKFWTAFFVAVLWQWGTFAKSSDDFDAKKMDVRLKANADAVLRQEVTSVKVLSAHAILINKRYAITVLNAEGDRYADFQEHYSLLSQLEDVAGKLYDSEGKLLRVMKNRELFDRSQFGTSFVLFSDLRIKHFSFNHRIYPYTVEYSFSKKLNSNLFIDPWQPQFSHRLALESASLELIYPKAHPIRTKDYHLPADAIANLGGNDSFEVKTIKLKSLPASVKEPFSSYGNYAFPSVELAMDEVSLLGNTGGNASWEQIARFNWELNKDRDLLSEEEAQKVKAIIGEEKDVRTIVDKLNKHLQKNYRYVANEYGIAGWQTFDALTVGKSGYGDCKGLTNYLKAMLKTAEVPAIAALVNAGTNHYKLDESFPNNRFNHVILCVPNNGDTIWVESTNPFLPAGYLGKFTANRKALLLLPEGGKLVHTPNYGAEKNYVHRTAHWHLDAQQQLNLKLHTKYVGPMMESILNEIKTKDLNEIKSDYMSRLPFGHFEIRSLSFKESDKVPTPTIDENIDLRLLETLDSAPKRLMLHLPWFQLPLPDMLTSGERTKGMVIDMSYEIIDTILLALPNNYEVELLPATIDEVQPFARFKIELNSLGKQLRLIQKLTVKEGEYEATLYPTYRNFYKKVQQAQHFDFVLIKSQ